MSNSTEYVYEMDGEDVVKVFFRMLIYVIGVIGNLLVIFVVLYLKEYKKITHWYVLQMALADIIFLQNLPVKVTEDINGRWVNSEWLCSAQQTVLFFTYYASILFLMIMAIDRYLAVCHPMSQTVRRVRTVRHAYIVSIVIWIISLGLSVPAMLYGTLSGTSPFCSCTLVFPLDARDWCIKRGFTGDSGFMSLDFCIGTVFKDVDESACINADPGIDFGDVDLPSGSNVFGSVAGGDVSSGNGLPNLGGGGDRPSTSASASPDLTNLLGDFDENDLFRPSTGDSASPDLTNLLGDFDENDLFPPSTGDSASPDLTNLLGGIDEKDLFPPSTGDSASPDLTNLLGGIDENDLFAPSTGDSASPDLTNLLGGIDENDLLPPPTGDSPSLDLTSLLGGIDESDLKQPSAASSTSGTEKQLFGSCYYDPERPGFIAYIYFNFVAMFLIPFVVLVVCYSLIVRRLVSSSNLSGNSSNGSAKRLTFKSKTPSTASASTGKSDREKTKVTILCFLLAALFTICWLPFHSVHLAKVFGIQTDEESFCGRLAIATSLLAYFGSAINPYLYNFLGSFKKRIRQIKSSTGYQSAMGASAATGATAAPRTSIPRSSSIVPSIEGSKGANSILPPEEIPLKGVETRL